MDVNEKKTAARSASPAAAARGDVKSAKRVLEILRFFARTKAPATLAQIAAGLNFPKSSCLALLDTLEGEGYAYTVDGRYYLTQRWHVESQIVASHDQIAMRFRPIMEKLHAELDETLILAQRSANKAVYLDVIEGGKVLRFTAAVGETKPLHAAASGRALLSALSDEDLAQILPTIEYEQFTPATPNTPEMLLASIEKGRNRGWHVNFGEYQSDTVSVAAPIVLPGLVMALVVGAPVSRAQHKVDVIGAALRDACAKASQQANAS